MGVFKLKKVAMDACGTFSQMLFNVANFNKLIRLKFFLCVTKLMPISDLTESLCHIQRRRPQLPACISETQSNTSRPTKLAAHLHRTESCPGQTQICGEKLFSQHLINSNNDINQVSTNKRKTSASLF